jgi:hypothetical protein
MTSLYPDQAQSPWDFPRTKLGSGPDCPNMFIFYFSLFLGEIPDGKLQAGHDHAHFLPNSLLRTSTPTFNKDEGIE